MRNGFVSATAYSFLLTAVLASAVGLAAAQSSPKPGKRPSDDVVAAPAQTTNPIRSSGAYAEVLLRKTELQADLESFLSQYTEDYPKVKQTRYELEMISKDAERLLAVKPSDAAKLTTALGKMMVRKVELQLELWALQQQLGDAHPDVKRARRKVEIYENAVKEILG
jgi:hypothetical protein